MIKKVTGGIRYQKLTEAEKKSRGILGRLVGVCADFINPTRNDRGYSEQLWENVFNDPLMQEKIKNKVCYGELGHPAERAEIDPEKIAVCLSEQPVKNEKGQLEAVFDILDTPNGRILKTLCDYGSTLGVSSRGQGDLIQDQEGNEVVDPDTYQCECWDIVLIPAVKEARLKYVTESLDNKNMKLRKALTEAYNKENEEGQKIMKQTLEDLNINLTESNNKEIKLSDCTKIDTYDQACEVVKKLKAEWSFGNFGRGEDNEGFGNSEGFFNAFKEKGEIYIYEDGKNSLAFVLDQQGQVVDGPFTVDNKKVEIQILKDITNNDDTKLDDNTSEEGESEIMEESLIVEEEEVLDINSEDVDTNKDELQDADELELGAPEDEEIDAETEEEPKEETELEVDSIVDENPDEEPVEEEQPELNVQELTDKINSEIIEDEEESEYNKGFNDALNKILELIKPEDEEVEDAEPTEEETPEEGEAEEIPEEATEEEVADEENSTEENSDEDIEAEEEDSEQAQDEVDEALDNGSKALVKSLQEALKGKSDLENTIKSLQEQLAVSNAKVDELNEEMNQYKAGMARLSTIAKSKTDLQDQVSRLEEQLEAKEKEINEQSIRISRLVKSRKESIELSESLNTKNDEIKALNEGINSAKEAHQNEIKQLNEKLISQTKESDNKIANLNESLTKANTLKESYKKLANDAMNMLIEERATKLGLTAKDIKRKLGASYTIADVNAVCEELKRYQLNVSKLPFSVGNKLGIRVNESISRKVSTPVNDFEDDEIDDTLMRLANLR